MDNTAFPAVGTQASGELLDVGKVLFSLLTIHLIQVWPFILLKIVWEEKLKIPCMRSLLALQQIASQRFSSVHRSK